MIILFEIYVLHKFSIKIFPGIMFVWSKSLIERSRDILEFASYFIDNVVLTLYIRWHKWFNLELEKKINIIYYWLFVFQDFYDITWKSNYNYSLNLLWIIVKYETIRCCTKFVICKFNFIIFEELGLYLLLNNLTRI